ncbi:MAG TPA: hypothetical protein VKG02_24065, partial [Blastocatellia bacterium]|nr:hypothetical protein [Blastocatellia bacterium]
LSFDQLRNKDLTMPLSATIEQVTWASINSQSQIDDPGASSGAGGEVAAQPGREHPPPAGQTAGCSAA